MSTVDILAACMGGSSGVYTGDIGHSLRFRGVASAYLSRTITTDATSTYFAAVKRGRLGVVTPVFDSSIKFNANDTLTAFGLTTTAVFRDPTSWLYIHVSNGGLYVNGVSYGAVTTSAITNLRIGYDGTNYADMYVARIGIVGGSSSSYTNFGYLNSETNAWVTKTESEVKAVVDAGGANSFMLEFNNATSLTTLGQDNSSKGNNWTCNNVSLTAGPTYDHMLDVPGNSYATMSPLSLVNTTYAATQDGNLNSNCVTGAISAVLSTIPITGKSWSVARIIAVGNGCTVGIALANGTSALIASNSIAYQLDGQKKVYGTSSAFGASYTVNDVIAIEVDKTAGTIQFFKQTGGSGSFVSQGTITDSRISSDQHFFVHYNNTSSGNSFVSWNFGQQPEATYVPTTGFKALCQANLPDGETIETSGTFTGTLAADGPYRDIKGTPLTMTINGNAVTWGTHADKTSSGFKLRTASSSYNNTGSNTFSITSTGAKRKYSTGQVNP